jgi:predicted amidohydrolase
MQNISIALCQNKPGCDKQENINHACAMIATAASNGARLAVLSEIFYYPYELRAIKRIADTGTSTIDRLREAASGNGIYLCTGTMAVRNGDAFYNTSFLIDPSGDILLEYGKSHLFDADIDGKEFRESSFITPGNRLDVAVTPFGTVGILVCYDIRFPEAARTLALRGAEIIIVPAAFNTTTGPAHWHVMFRARAIENQVYILAVSQARAAGSAYEVYGHSMVVDPWGEVIAEAAQEEAILYAELNAGVLENTRKRLPLLSQRRPELYDI